MWSFWDPYRRNPERSFALLSKAQEHVWAIGRCQGAKSVVGTVLIGPSYKQPGRLVHLTFQVDLARLADYAAAVKVQKNADL